MLNASDLEISGLFFGVITLVFGFLLAVYCGFKTFQSFKKILIISFFIAKNIIISWYKTIRDAILTSIRFIQQEKTIHSNWIRKYYDSKNDNSKTDVDPQNNVKEQVQVVEDVVVVLPPRTESYDKKWEVYDEPTYMRKELDDPFFTVC